MPAPLNRDLSILMLSDPAKAIAQCRQAMKDAEGNADRAADILGIGRRTLFRWMKEHPEIKEWNPSKS